MTKENLQQGGSEKKYSRYASRLYRQFTNSFTIPFKRLQKMARRKIKILARKIKGGGRQ